MLILQMMLMNWLILMNNFIYVYVMTVIFIYFFSEKLVLLISNKFKFITKKFL